MYLLLFFLTKTLKEILVHLRSTDIFRNSTIAF